MNSLAFLFRQFDALAVSGRRLLPSTLTGGDTPSYNGNTDESDPILNRKQTISSDPSLISSDGNIDSSNRNRKRSCSAPMEPKPPGISDTSKLVNLPRHTLKPHYPSLGKRIYLVRLVASLYDWLAATWSSLTRSNSEIGYTEEETEKGGQESSDEEKSYASQERPISSLSTISSSRQSPYSSIIASPLSQSVTPPTVNLIPPDSPNSSEMSEIPSPSSSQTHLPTSIRASSSVVSPNSIMSSTPNAPRSPFHLPKTLVLDLDETLIHSTTRPLSPQRSLGFGLLRGFILGKKSKGTSHMVEVVLGNKSTSYHVYKRPFTDYFLRKVSGWYTLVIFTASMQEYADPVIDWLDAGRGILARRLFRDSCTQLPNGSYTKDLSLVEEDLSRICLIDNSPLSYSINQANGIPIEGWTHDPTDEALLDLLPVLDSLRFTSDVRRVLGIRGFS